MRRPWSAAALWLAVALASAVAGAEEMTLGKPEIRSMSALAFAPGGVLLVGDSRSGALFALEVADEGVAT